MRRDVTTERASQVPPGIGLTNSRVEQAPGRVEARAAEQHPWERARDESTEAYAAFVLYRELGPDRSLRAAARQLGKSERLLKRWSSRHRWQDRMAAWEEQKEAQADEAPRQAREDARERRIRNAEQLEKVGMAGLRSLMVRDGDTGEVRFDKRLKPGEIVAFIRVAYRIFPTPEAPTPSEEEVGSPEALARLGDEDLDLLLSMVEGEKNKKDGAGRETAHDEQGEPEQYR